jgi:hypothetical protein
MRISAARRPGHERVQVPLDLGDREVEALAPLHPEALVEQRAVHALDEAVGARTANLRVPMRDVLDCEQELVGMASGLPQNSRRLSVR